MDVLEQFKIAYDIHWWLRYITWCALIGAGLLLFKVSGGLPPSTWRLLAQVIPQVSRLFALRGLAIFLPLSALVFLCLTWGVLWGLLLWGGIAVIWHWWRSRHPLPPVETNWRRSTAPLTPNILAHQISPLPGISGQFRVPQEVGAGDPFSIPYEAIKMETNGFKHMLQASPIPITNDLGINGATTVTQYASHLGEGVGWDPGIKRRHKPNEDSLIVLRGTCTHNDRLLTFGLFVVADGMGGHADGQEASRMAIHCMLQSVLPTMVNGGELSDALLMETLTDGVQWANQAIWQRGQEYDVAMGTTLTAALVLDTTAYIVNVGDSRTYRYRPGEGLRQITRDHSVVARLVERGEIAPEEIYTHPKRNQVYRGLGDKGEVEVDTFTLRLQGGDCLVLCSDGVWEMVRDPEIERIMKHCGASPAQASDALLQAALQGGGADNISVIVVPIASKAETTTSGNHQGIYQLAGHPRGALRG